ncbi:MAG: tetratricopeptide repeat protein [Candidatus Obscuribacterales bacterium]|nr:tetratricopeptide repeat protein [Candidatus Obscuribacterales bacterium]
MLFSASTLPSFGMDRQPIKSYEIEHQVYEQCNRAVELINASNYSQAINLLTQAARMDPTSYSDFVHEKLSECYSETNQTDKAIKEAELALKYDPSSGAAYYYLAQIYYRTDHYDTATVYLKKLLQITKDKQWADRAKELLKDIETYGKARAAIDQINAGHLSQARKFLEDAAKYDPSPVSKNVHQSLSYVYRESGNPEQAIVEAKKALQYDANDGGLMYTIALASQDIGEYDDAIVWLKRSLQYERDPERRKNAADMISELELDKPKLNSQANKAPDYLDSMVGAGGACRWPQKKLPIKVFIKSGAGVKGFRSEYPSFIKHALDSWCSASGRKLAYKMVGDEKSADLSVTWIDDPILMNEDGKKRVKQGVASTETTSEREITSVQVQVDTMNALRPNQLLEAGECASVCLHEIGHSLGLKHSTSYNDVMFFGSSSKQSGDLTSRDKATIARLYQSYPVCSLAPVEQKPPPIKFEPPPMFMPPLPGDEKDIAPPIFLPPPIDESEEKLTPPFFQPPPLNDAAGSANSKNKKPDTTMPPVFLPPPIESESGTGKNSKQAPKKNSPNSNSKQAPKTSGVTKQDPKMNKSDSSKKDPGEPLPFFTPPPLN